MRFIKNCSFGDDKQEEIAFTKLLFRKIFSGIKKRILIKDIISEFKNIVRKDNKEILWPKSSGNLSAQVTQEFVISFMLKNAEPSLRI
jgi:hypothetical protein